MYHPPERVCECVKNDGELNGPVARNDRCGEVADRFSLGIFREIGGMYSVNSILSLATCSKTLLRCFRPAFVCHSGNHCRGGNYSDSEQAFRRKKYFSDFFLMSPSATFMQTIFCECIFYGLSIPIKYSAGLIPPRLAVKKVPTHTISGETFCGLENLIEGSKL